LNNLKRAAKIVFIIRIKNYSVKIILICAVKMNFFAKNLLKWYKINRRDLPWRHTKDPYKIWLSEIIMQQTQVVQGLSYYLKFVKTYPKVELLAAAPTDEVMKLWQGLGYYSRARNLHEAAKFIVKEYKGIFPKDYIDIRHLKGVGDYTAAAIASFAFDLPYAVVDGNVYRVLSRVFGIDTPIDTGAGKKEFQALASTLLPGKEGADYNQALMEFGAVHCRPVNPDCTACIFQSKCLAFSEKKVASLPLKSKKTKVTNRYFNYIVYLYKNEVYIKKRHKKDIWQGLFEFDLIESKKRIPEERFISSKEFSQHLNPKKYKTLAVSKEYKHILSHQHLFARFYKIELKQVLNSKEFVKAGKKDLDRYAFPRLIEKYLKEEELIN
jgi:A/G-specific adenine glycosylase